jgi:hypothetical protein
MRNIECLGQVGDVLGGSFGLTVKDRCSGYLVATDLLGDFFEAKLLLSLGGKEGLG